MWRTLEQFWNLKEWDLQLDLSLPPIAHIAHRLRRVAVTDVQEPSATSARTCTFRRVVVEWPPSPTRTTISPHTLGTPWRLPHRPRRRRWETIVKRAQRTSGQLTARRGPQLTGGPGVRVVVQGPPATIGYRVPPARGIGTPGPISSFHPRKNAEEVTVVGAVPSPKTSGGTQGRLT